MSYLSDFQRQSATLRGKAGPFAIAQNDLLILNAIGQLYPAAVSDYAAFPGAGNTAVGPVTVGTGYNQGANGRNSLLTASDLSSYTGAPNSGNNGLSLYKYSSTGTLLASVSLDSTAAIPGQITLGFLSNGNILCVWGMQAGAINFAVVDTNLAVVVAKTAITASPARDNSNLPFLDAIPLSGGGFAVGYAMTANINLAIYTNAGGVTFAGAAIPSTPPTDGSTVAAAPRLAQLSSGDIAIAVTSTTPNQALGHAVRSVTGVAVKAFTLLDTTNTLGGTATVSYPEISVIAGTYCCVVGDWATNNAYVLNNAGTLQGGAYSSAFAFTSVGYKVVNDGSAYWGIFGSGGSVTTKVVYIPVTGTGYVTNSLAAAGAPGCAAYDRGFIVSSQLTVALGAAGTASYFGAGVTSALTAIPVGDFAVLTTTANLSTFKITKYLAASVVGVAQSTLAAGNAGTLINYLSGPSAYPINPIAGTIGKKFNHVGATVSGNAGVMLGNSVQLNGIGSLGRNIN